MGRAWTPMRQFGQIREGGRAEINQMLSLRLAAGALAGHGGDALGAMLGQDVRVSERRSGVGFEMMNVFVRAV